MAFRLMCFGLQFSKRLQGFAADFQCGAPWVQVGRWCFGCFATEALSMLGSDRPNTLAAPIFVAAADLEPQNWLERTICWNFSWACWEIAATRWFVHIICHSVIENSDHPTTRDHHCEEVALANWSKLTDWRWGGVIFANFLCLGFVSGTCILCIYTCLHKSFGQLEIGVMSPTNIHNECFPSRRELGSNPKTRLGFEPLQGRYQFRVHIPHHETTHPWKSEIFLIGTESRCFKKGYMSEKETTKITYCKWTLLCCYWFFPFQGYLSEEALQNLPVNEQDGPKHQRMFEQLGPAGDFLYFPMPSFGESINGITW